MLKLGKDKSIVEKKAEDRKKESKKDKISERYVVSVYSRLNKTPPEYNPLGYYEKDQKWKTEIGEGKNYARGWIERESSRTTLNIECTTSDNPEIEREIESEKESDKFTAKCFVITDPTDSSKQLVQGFEHSNLSLYIYDASAEELIYNDDSRIAEMFSFWFGRGEPKTMIELIKETVEGEIFEIEELEGDLLNLKRDESKRLVEELVSQGKVLEISQGGGTYALE